MAVKETIFTHSLRRVNDTAHSSRIPEPHWLHRRRTFKAWAHQACRIGPRVTTGTRSVQRSAALAAEADHGYRNVAVDAFEPDAWSYLDTFALLCDGSRPDTIGYGYSSLACRCGIPWEPVDGIAWTFAPDVQ